MKFLRFLLPVLLCALLASAQQFDNPTSIPVKFYGEGLAMALQGNPSTFSFGLSPTETTTVSSYANRSWNGYTWVMMSPKVVNSPVTTALVVPGKTYTVSVTSSSMSYVVAKFLPVNGCRIFIDSMRSTTMCRGTNYTFTLRVERGVALSSEGVLRAGSAGQLDSSSPQWRVSLGRLKSGSSAGSLGLNSSVFTSDLGKVSSLYELFASSEEVEVERPSNDPSGVVLRVSAPEAIAEVVDTSATDGLYEIRFRREITEAPYVRYRVRVNTTGLDLNIDRLEDGALWRTRLLKSGGTVTHWPWERLATGLADFTDAYSFAADAPKVVTTITTSGSSVVESSDYGVCSGATGSGSVSYKVKKTFGVVNNSLELLSQSTGEGADTLTRSYAYYASTDAATGAWASGLKSVVQPSGDWTKYEYFTSGTEAGLVSKVFRPWGSAPASPAAQSGTAGVIETWTYTTNWDGMKTAPASKEVRVNGVLVGKTTWSYEWNHATSNGRVVAKKTETAYASASETLVSDTLVPDTLVSETLFYRDDAVEAYYAGKPYAAQAPDGSKDVYVYEKGSWNASSGVFSSGADAGARRILVFHGRKSSETGTTAVNSWGGQAMAEVHLLPNFSTVTEAVIDAYGHVVLGAENLYTSSGLERVSAQSSIYNEANLRTKLRDLIRSTSSVKLEETTIYTGGLVSSTVGTDGVQTDYTVDRFLSTTEVERGVGGASEYPAVKEFTAFYPAGFMKSVSGTDGERLARDYDAHGRLTKERSPAPGSGDLFVSYTYADQGRTVTRKDPKGATFVTTRALDGRVLREAGTGQALKTQVLTVNTDGSTTLRSQYGEDGVNGWSEVTNDWLGRPLYSRAPQCGWNVSAGAAKVTRRVPVYEAGTGRLKRVDYVNEETGGALIASHIYGYGKMGLLVEEGEDLNNNHVLDAGGTDRIVRTELAFYKDSWGWVREQKLKVLAQAGSAAETQLSRTCTRLTGFNNSSPLGSAVAVADVMSFDASGRWTVSWDWIDAASKFRLSDVVVQTGAQSTAHSNQVTLNGYVASVRDMAGLEKEFSYNAQGQLASEALVADLGPGSDAISDRASYTYYAKTGVLASVTRQLDDTRTSTETYCYAWDAASLRSSVCVGRADGSEVRTQYNAYGQLEATWGKGAQAVANTYDAVGRLTAMSTWTESEAFDGTGAFFPNVANASVTSLQLDPASGLVLHKSYPAKTDGTSSGSESFEYNARAQLYKRTGARGLVSTYGYDGSTGELLSVQYSGSSSVTTPNLAYTYTRTGALNTVTDATGTRSFAYRADLKGDYEQLSVDPDANYKPLPEGFYGNLRLTSTYDDLGRNTGYSLNTSTAISQTVGFDPATGRLLTIDGSMGANTTQFTVGYNPANGLVASIVGAGGAFERRFVHEADRSVMSSVETLWGGSSLGRFQATFAEALGRQDSLSSGSENTGGWSYKVGLGAGIEQHFTYDKKGRMQTASLPTWINSSKASAVALSDFTSEWKYNNQGSRIEEIIAGKTTNYAPNAANQYESITGEKAEPLAAQEKPYDLDGNLSEDGTASYSYDHENRLVKVVQSVDAGTQTLVFTYDYLGRRVRKEVTGVSPSDTKYLYAGWKLIAELGADGVSPRRAFVWGPDYLDARGSGAGAGGLLAQIDSRGVSYAMTDHHGSVVGYVDSAGTVIVARHFDVMGQALAFDQYGKRTTTFVHSGKGEARDYPFGFSGQYTDAETGLVYYGLRYYQPRHGRFINRDPIREAGGYNLYALCGNRGVGLWDRLGLHGNDVPDPNAEDWWDGNVKMDSFEVTTDPWTDADEDAYLEALEQEWETELQSILDQEFMELFQVPETYDDDLCPVVQTPTKPSPLDVFKRDSTGNLIFTPTGKVTKKFNGVGRADVTVGYLVTKDGVKVEVYRNESGDRRVDRDCHGYSMADGRYWMNNTEMQHLLSSTSLVEQKSGPALGLVAVWRDENDDVQHSGIVVAIDAGGPIITQVAGTLIFPEESTDVFNTRTDLWLAYGWTKLEYWGAK